MNSRFFLLFITCLQFCLTTVKGQQYTSANNTKAVTDTTIYVNDIAEPKSLPAAVNIDLNDPLLQDKLQSKITSPAERHQLLNYLKLRTNTAEETNKLYSTLSNIFTRLKLYPLAIKCFYASRMQDKLNYNNLSLFNHSGHFNFSSKDDSLINRQVVQSPAPKGNYNSKEINYRYIDSIFNDGKPSIAYALLIHTKQPVAGKRQVHRLANAGHSFITLIKYNSDSSSTSLSFSFYAKKKHPFAGTPLFPASASTFKDDTYYQCDEVAGKFIDERTFRDILLLTKHYSNLKYHLSKRNCTDFSLDAAQLAGICITETYGKWPLGKGNNPGITGQSILLGKIQDRQATAPGSLFISYDSKLAPAQ
jgi:hypothetical protein